MITIKINTGHPGFDGPFNATVACILAWRWWIVGAIAVVQLWRFWRNVNRRRQTAVRDCMRAERRRRLVEGWRPGERIP